MSGLGNTVIFTTALMIAIHKIPEGHEWSVTIC